MVKFGIVTHRRVHWSKSYCVLWQALLFLLSHSDAGYEEVHILVCHLFSLGLFRKLKSETHLQENVSAQLGPLRIHHWKIRGLFGKNKVSVKTKKGQIWKWKRQMKIWQDTTEKKVGLL